MIDQRRSAPAPRKTCRASRATPTGRCSASRGRRRPSRLTLALHERGLFTWKEWASALAAEIKRAQGAGDPDTGETYYLHWLAALERLVAEKGVASRDTLARYRDAWDHACDRTPHGKPIELRAEDFR